MGTSLSFAFRAGKESDLLLFARLGLAIRSGFERGHLGQREAFKATSTARIDVTDMRYRVEGSPEVRVQVDDGTEHAHDEVRLDDAGDVFDAPRRKAP